MEIDVKSFHHSRRRPAQSAKPAIPTTDKLHLSKNIMCLDFVLA